MFPKIKPMRPRIFSLAILVVPIPLGVFLNSKAIEPLLTSEYSPRRALYMAHPWLLWTNVISDLLIGLSYVLFFYGLCWLIAKLKGVPELTGYLWVLSSFRIFIMASGASVLIRIAAVWWPMYQISILLKIVCAAAATPTAIIFASQARSMAANVHRFFDLLATQKLQADALRKSQDFLDRTGRIAGIGGWEVDLIADEVTWSTETYRIHGAPLDYKPTLQEGIKMYAPEARPTIISAVLTASAGGPGWDLELPVIRVDGRPIMVRSVGEVDFRDEKPVRLVGAFQDITGEVATREALRQANERVALATESGGIGIFDWDIKQDLCAADPWMHRLYGLEPPGCATPLQYWAAPMHPEDRPNVIEALEDAMADRRPYDTEFRVVWQDGSIHHIRATARVTRDEFNTPTHVIGVNWDVTESRRLTAELAEQHELLRITLQSIGDGVITTDVNRKVLWLNPVAERMTGWSTAEASGRPLLEVFKTLNAQTREVVDNPVANLPAQGSSLGVARETVLISRDGTEFGIENQVAPIRDGNGQLLGTILGFRDVTEARRLVSELAKQHELLGVTLQSIGDGVITKDMNRNVLWMNTVAERMTGWSTSDAVHRSIDDVFQAVDEKTRLPLVVVFSDLSDKSSTATAIQPGLLISRDGTERFIETSATPLWNGSGNIHGNILVFRDVTEERRLAAETERVSKLQLELKTKDEFLSHVSHELRSPLTSIYSFSSIIADDLAGATTPEQKEYLQIILKNVVQLQSMIEDLLTVTQTREGKLSIELQSVTPADAVSDAIHTLRSAASTKQIVLTANDSMNLPAACADPTRLRQILIILLDNAIKFTPEGGSVSVSVSQSHQDRLLFQVSDTGCGIPEEKRTLVFENLYQITGPAAPDTSQQGRIGLGLGLHIARNLVTRQGGHIWVTEAPEHGSVFNFTLPVFFEGCIPGEAGQSYPRRRKTDKTMQNRPTLLPAA